MGSLPFSVTAGVDKAADATLSLFIMRALRIAKSNCLLRHVRPSVRPSSAWNTSASTERIFIEFYIVIVNVILL